MFLYKTGWFSFDIQTKKLLKNKIEGNNYLWNSVGSFERSLKPPPKLTSLSWPEKDIIHLETEKSLSYSNASGNLKEIRFQICKKKICLPIRFYVLHQKSLSCFNIIHLEPAGNNIKGNQKTNSSRKIFTTNLQETTSKATNIQKNSKRHIAETKQCEMHQQGFF